MKNFPLIGKFYTLPFLINLNEFMRINSTPENNLAIDIDDIENSYNRIHGIPPM